MKSTGMPTSSFTFTPTPAQTLKWMSETWEFEANPWFGHFFNILGGGNDEIPSQYLAALKESGSGWNPTFRFLRPNSVESILAALKGTCASKRGLKTINTIWDGVIRPYLASWEKLFEELSAFYGGYATVKPVQEKFRLLKYHSIIFREIQSQNDLSLADRLNPKYADRSIYFDKDSYTSEFNRFTELFTQLRTSPSNPELETIKEAVSMAAHSGAVKANKSLIASAKKIAEEAYKNFSRGEPAFRKRGTKGGRPKKNGLERAVVKSMVEQWKETSKKSKLRFVTRFYHDTKTWQANGWMDGEHRLCWAQKPCERLDKQAIMRLYASFNRELAQPR